jgi:hypothetical protein
MTGKYGVPSAEMVRVSKRLQAFGKKLEGNINAMAGAKMGFALLIFDFEKEGRIEYLSNARREDMLKAMLEFMENAVRTDRDPPGSHEIV